jgi:phosphate transport system substrate-binding protein
MRRLKTMTAPLILAAVAVAGGWGCGKTPKPPSALVGKGSTFVYPLMVQWTNAYAKTEQGCKVEYAAVGSGSGIRGIIENSVDFACTDGPLTEKQLAEARAAGGDVVHIPLVLGAVVPAYNLGAVAEPLRFSGPVLADIYLGKIKKWNDRAIKELNPKVADRLPDAEIVVVHRSDGSGTTYIWTDYLAKVSKEWAEKVGVGVEVRWPVGVAEAGNEGVADRVDKTPASIGYVELTYALRRDLAFGLVQNRENEFVRAGPRSIRRAAANGLKDIPEDLRYSLTNAPGKGSYPVCGTTWAIVRVNPPAGKGHQLLDFLPRRGAEGGRAAVLRPAARGTERARPQAAPADQGGRLS